MCVCVCVCVRACVRACVCMFVHNAKQTRFRREALRLDLLQLSMLRSDQDNRWSLHFQCLRSL